MVCDKMCFPSYTHMLWKTHFQAGIPHIYRGAGSRSKQDLRNRARSSPGAGEASKQPEVPIPLETVRDRHGRDLEATPRAPSVPLQVPLRLGAADL